MTTDPGKQIRDEARQRKLATAPQVWVEEWERRVAIVPLTMNQLGTILHIEDMQERGVVGLQLAVVDPNSGQQLLNSAAGREALEELGADSMIALANEFANLADVDLDGEIDAKKNNSPLSVD